MAGLRNVPLVFPQRKYFKRDEFGYRKFLPRQENRLPRRTPAHCKNYVRASRAQLFYRRVVRNVRGLWLSTFDLQPANNLLSVRDDLLIIGAGLADEFANGFYARHWAIRRYDVAIRLLGYADFLELEINPRTISRRDKIKSCLLFS